MFLREFKNWKYKMQVGTVIMIITGCVGIIIGTGQCVKNQSFIT